MFLQKFSLWVFLSKSVVIKWMPGSQRRITEYLQWETAIGLAIPSWPNLLWGRDTVSCLFSAEVRFWHTFAVPCYKSWCAGVRNRSPSAVTDAFQILCALGGKRLMWAVHSLGDLKVVLDHDAQIRLKKTSFHRHHLILIFSCFWIYFRKILFLSRSRRVLLRRGALCCSLGWGRHKRTQFRCPHLPSGLTCCTPGLFLEGLLDLCWPTFGPWGLCLPQQNKSMRVLVCHSCQRYFRFWQKI